MGVGHVHKVAVGNFFVPNTKLNEGKFLSGIFIRESSLENLHQRILYLIYIEVHRPIIGLRNFTRVGKEL